MKEGYSSQQYKVYFDADPSGEGDSLAASFADFISEVDDGLEVERVRPSPEHMDFGSVVLLILSAPAIVAVAKGIEAWFARHPSAKIKVQKP
ncbi:MAG TPA: hypothetical protein VLX28_27090, partial [Thermoanaerobaculia bacterium]|nr:hypothetical protein [Thermoanaerobaculia bacterium]